MSKEISVSPAEFEKIPLDFIIATPLTSVIQAHILASQATLKFIRDLNDKGQVQKFLFQVKETDGAGKEKIVKKEIEVPLMALVKIPSLTFDSLSIAFNYNISQIEKEEKGTTGNADLEISTSPLLSKFVNAKLTGSVEHTTRRENTANRGGSLEVKVHVSESGMPAGLQKIMNALTESIGAALGEVPKDKP